MSFNCRSGIGFLQALNSEKSYWVKYELKFDSESGELAGGRVRNLVNHSHPVMNFYSLRLAEGKEFEVFVRLVGSSLLVGSRTDTSLVTTAGQITFRAKNF